MVRKRDVSGLNGKVGGGFWPRGWGAKEQYECLWSRLSTAEESSTNATSKKSKCKNEPSLLLLLQRYSAAARPRTTYFKVRKKQYELYFILNITFNHGFGLTDWVQQRCFRKVKLAKKNRLSVILQYGLRTEASSRPRRMDRRDDSSSRVSDFIRGKLGKMIIIHVLIHCITGKPPEMKEWGEGITPKK